MSAIYICSFRSQLLFLSLSRPHPRIMQIRCGERDHDGLWPKDALQLDDVMA